MTAGAILILREGWGGVHVLRRGKPTPLTSAIWVTHCADDSPRLPVVQGPRVLSAMLTGDPCQSAYVAPLTSPIFTVQTEGQGGASVSPSPEAPPQPHRVASGSSGRRLAMTDLAQSRRDPTQSNSFAYICQTFCHLKKKKYNAYEFPTVVCIIL